MVLWGHIGRSLPSFNQSRPSSQLYEDKICLALFLFLDTSLIIRAIISKIIYLYNIITIPEMVCHQASLIYLVLMAFVLGSQVYSFFLLNHLYFGKIMRFKRIYFLNMLRFYKVKGNALQHNLPKVGARHGGDWEVQESSNFVVRKISKQIIVWEKSGINQN